ncbi:MAG TPA: hypothetical protein VFG20_10180, partial [Planctomycetaceae bacterium]|nr:hypothetical protein [Planctomycetaceae bacterium]
MAGFARCGAAFVVMSIACGIMGCNGGAAPSADDQAAPATASKSKTGKAKSGGNPSTSPLKVDADGRKWLGDIPLDVFYDDPLAVVADSAKVAPTMAADPGTPATPAKTDTPAPATTDSATAGMGSDWKDLISIDQVQAETKRIRNHLTVALQSAGTYNGHYKELQVDGAVMAALANIVAQHPESVTWKPNAKFIRDYGHQLSEAATALGKEAFEKSQTASEKMTAVLDGNAPSDDNVAPQRPFGEVANRAGVMKRIEKASEWMRTNIATENKFKSELEQIQTEATMIATLGKVVTDPSYDSASEDDYQGWAKSLIDGAREAAASTQEQAFPKFQSAINKINKACQDCHAS